MSGERSGKRKWDVGRVGCGKSTGHYLHNFLIDFLIRVLNILVQVVTLELGI